MLKGKSDSSMAVPTQFRLRLVDQFEILHLASVVCAPPEDQAASFRDPW
jgi:hypothetical protein